MRPRARLAAGWRAALIASLSIGAVILLHELFTFGLIHDRIHLSDAGCYAGDCAGIMVVLIGVMFLGLVAGLVCLPVGAILPRGRLRMLYPGALWLVLTTWALSITASGYRGGFGATWRWWEPFVELLFHPIVTPVLLAAGLSGLLWMLRKGDRDARIRT